VICADGSGAGIEKHKDVNEGAGLGSFSVPE
jgi:hypothetical protein